MMTEEEKVAVHAAIHSASVAAGAVCWIPIPGADSVPLVGIQTTMAMGIAKALGLSLGEGAAQAALGTAMATAAGKYVAGTLMGMIPGIGPVLKAGTAATLTEALGWALANDFDMQRGG